MSPAIARSCIRALAPLRPASPALAAQTFTRVQPTVSRSYSSSKMSDQVNVFTKGAPAALGPYSQAVKTPTTIYCSGQIPLTPEGTFIEGTIGEKTAQCCKNVEAVLKEAGSSLPRVVKTTIFLSDMAHFASMNEEYEKWFSHKPARSCVAVKTLPKNVDVEIEAIALHGEEAKL